MIKLKDMILQLKEEDYDQVSKKLASTKADKFLFLFTLMRENKLNDDDIATQLAVNQSAYYTLKSRLYDKVQEFLASNLEGSRADLLHTVSTIPNLVYNTPREQAIVILKKLEEDLIKHDLPHELRGVYGALKKLHLHSQKYYEYSQQYNKHLAYTASLDKGEDLIADFHKTLGEYYLSKDIALTDILVIIKKEMAALAELYRSHHLAIYKNIINISFAIFVTRPDAVKDDEPIEDMLDYIEKTLLLYDKDITYKYLLNIHNFLKFEYYMHLKQYKKAKVYYEQVNDSLPSFMLCSFCCFTSRFLLSALEYRIHDQSEKAMVEENAKIFESYKPDTDDIPNYVNFVKSQAICALLSGNEQEAISQLQKLLNNISTRNFSHTEVELKLLLTYAYILANKDETAFTYLKNVTRKIRELNESGEYEQVQIFSKMLQLLLSSKALKDNSLEKLLKLRNQFRLNNEGRTRMLEYLPMDDASIAKLCRS
ncbi:MAG: hypothetical protein HYU69_14155 [Bacteroidetes bacterium]|nr:hypothetical protein [Bacteroidota bacterium]